MKTSLTASLLLAILTHPTLAESTDDTSNCGKLVALFIELANRSGDTVTEAQARAEVLAENPSEAECAAMLALFEAQK